MDVLTEQMGIVVMLLDHAESIIHSDPLNASMMAATVVMALHYVKANGASQEFIRTTYDRSIDIGRRCRVIYDRLN